MAAMPACFTLSGVGKSGSPGPKSTTSMPCSRSFCAASMTAIVFDTEMREIRVASFMNYFSFLNLCINRCSTISGTSPAIDLNVRKAGFQDFAHDLDALLHREERRLLRIRQYGDDDAVEQTRAALDDVHVAKRQWIE